MSFLHWTDPTIPVMEEAYIIVAFDNEELEIYQHENPGETVGAQYAPYWSKKIVAWAFAPFDFPFHMQKRPGAKAGSSYDAKS